MNLPEKALSELSHACRACAAPLAAHEAHYHLRCARPLWDRAPLPEGHPAGCVGADLYRERASAPGGQLDLFA